MPERCHDPPSPRRGGGRIGAKRQKFRETPTLFCDLRHFPLRAIALDYIVSGQWSPARMERT